MTHQINEEIHLQCQRMLADCCIEIGKLRKDRLELVCLLSSALCCYLNEDIEFDIVGEAIKMTKVVKTIRRP